MKEYVVYMQGTRCRYYLHAWNEEARDGNWVLDRDVAKRLTTADARRIRDLINAQAKDDALPPSVCWARVEVA